MQDPWSPRQRRDAERFVLALVETCVRNTSLETLHAGRGPVSEIGDFSDVKVVDARGEIAWNEVSRISQEEMKALTIEVVDRVFTFLSFPEDLVRLGAASSWNRPKFDERLMRTIENRRALAQGADPSEVYGAGARAILEELGLADTTKDGD